MRGFAHNEFNEFNNTEARMQDSCYHMTLKSHLIRDYATFIWLSTHKVLKLIKVMHI